MAFRGEEIINGNEDTHKWLPEDLPHIDHYSRTKQEAEQITIGANGQRNADGFPLKTCVLR